MIKYCIFGIIAFVISYGYISQDYQYIFGFWMGVIGLDILTIGDKL